VDIAGSATACPGTAAVGLPQRSASTPTAGTKSKTGRLAAPRGRWPASALKFDPFPALRDASLPEERKAAVARWPVREAVGAESICSSSAPAPRAMHAVRIGGPWSASGLLYETRLPRPEALADAGRDQHPVSPRICTRARSSAGLELPGGHLHPESATRGILELRAIANADPHSDLLAPQLQRPRWVPPPSRSRAIPNFSYRVLRQLRTAGGEIASTRLSRSAPATSRPPEPGWHRWTRRVGRYPGRQFPPPPASPADEACTRRNTLS